MAYIFSLFTQGISLGFTAAVSPGPFLVYVMTETLARGWRHSLPIIFSPLVSDWPIVLVTLIVLNQLPSDILRVIQIVGGAFILYLAWGIFIRLRQRAAIKLTDDAVRPARSPVWRGITIGLLSPGAWVFWSTVNGPIVVKAWRESPINAIAFVLGFYGVFIGGIAVLVAIFHQARRLDERVVRTLLVISMVVMAVFGALILKTGLLG